MKERKFKMKRKLLLLLCAATCVLSLLTACEKDKETGSQGNGNSNVKKESSEEQAENQKTLSSVFSMDNNAIWYFVDTSESNTKNLGKDSYPDEYYIFSDGELTYYYFSDETVPYSLGELSQMTDDEIITALESMSSESPDNSNRQSERLEACNQTIALMEQVSEYSEQIDSMLPTYGLSGTVSDAKALLEQCKSILESTNESDTGTTYSLKGFALYTDSTGNNVLSEDIAYGYIRSLSPSDRVNFDFEGFNDELSHVLSALENQETDIEQLMILLAPLCNVENQGDIILEGDQAKHISYIEDISGGLTNAQVYDSYFGGYRCKDGYLVTKTDEKTTFVLDSLDTPNIVIDPKSDDWVEE